MNKKFLYFTAFVTGAAVMVVELTASRLLAPFFGASLYVWTNVIGLILVALALGYWLGGRLAETPRRAKLLWEIILAAGVTCAVIPFAVTPLSRGVALNLILTKANGSIVILLGSFCVLLALFAIPVFLLGMVSPFVIRLLTENDKAIGAVSGRLFAISTAGSMLGTFLPALVLVSALGSRRTILAAAAALVVLAIFGMGFRRRAGIGAAIAVLIVAASPAGLSARAGLIEEVETPYQYVSIQDEAEYGRTMRFNEGFGIQSVMPGANGRTGFYWDYVPPLAALAGDPAATEKSELFLGLAGGTIVRESEALWGSKVKIKAVEIDPAVVALAKKYFGLDELTNLTVDVEDGRMALERDQNKYDLILVDAFTNQLYIPSHMATEEFFKLARTRLAPGGILVLNAAVHGEDSLLHRKLIASLRAAFPEVWEHKLAGSWNYLVVASDQPLDWSSLPDRVPVSASDLAEELAAGMAPAPDPKTTPFTDDNSPVELYTDAQVFEVLKNGGK